MMTRGIRRGLGCRGGFAEQTEGQVLAVLLSFDDDERSWRQWGVDSFAGDF